MKTLQIDAQIKDFADKPIQGVEGPLTSKDILIQCIGAFFSSPDAKENIRANDLGRKLYKADKSIELEDAEFDLLDKAVNKAIKDQRYSPIVVSHISILLKSAEE